MADITREQTGSRSRFLPVIRLEHLWVLVILSGIGFFIGLTRTDPNDFWWHLKAGQLTATNGLPTTNMFAWTLPADTPFVYQSWLGEWLYYVLYQMGGLQLVIFARNMLALGAFALVSVEAFRRSGSWRLGSGAALLALLMSINNLSTRTQNWSWIPFLLVLLLLGSYATNRLSPRWLIALPLIMIFWVNVHGGFMMGLLVTGAYVVGETLRRILRQPYALNWPRLRWLYAAALVMLAATIVNPLGVGVFGYVGDLLTDTPSQRLILEGQPPNPGHFPEVVFFASVLLLIAVFGLGRRRPSITDVLLVCGLGWMAFNGVRYVVWFAMAAMPVVAQSLAKPRAAIAPGAADAAAPRRRVGSPAINLALTLLLAAAVLMVQPWLKPAIPFPEDYRELFAPVPGAPLQFSSDTPVLAAEHLRNEPCDGRLFNELGYGSYLIWALYPETQVFIDPRVELFPIELWEDYIQLNEGRDIAPLLAQHDIACVLLDAGTQPQLSEALSVLPGWSLDYEDGQSELWRRNRDA